MTEKTILARLKRKWQGQEKDRIIWNEGILPNFITPNGKYSPSSFTCYELYKILQESFSYQNLYKHLRKYEMEEFLTSELVINKNNRKERIYSFSERGSKRKLYTIKYIQNKDEKVKAQELFEMIQKYNLPKKIYNDYNMKKISKNNALNTLQYIINQGNLFDGHQLETSLFCNSLDYFVKISQKDENLFAYLEEIVVCHEEKELQNKAFNYIEKCFPNLQFTQLSKFKKENEGYFSKSVSLDDYILTNERFIRTTIYDYLRENNNITNNNIRKKLMEEAPSIELELDNLTDKDINRKREKVMILIRGEKIIMEIDKNIDKYIYMITISDRVLYKFQENNFDCCTYCYSPKKVDKETYIKRAKKYKSLNEKRYNRAKKHEQIIKEILKKHRDKILFS